MAPLIEYLKKAERGGNKAEANVNVQMGLQEEAVEEERTKGGLLVSEDDVTGPRVQ